MKQLTVYSLLAVCLACIACKKDFIAEDITTRTVAVNGPSNNLATTTNLITFWWEPLEGADKYNLQVVKPSFSQVAQLMLDTNVSGTKFNLSLQPGAYQWRIKAANAGYSTAFQTFDLKIDTASNLSALLVNLLYPANNSATGNRAVTFSWAPLPGATKYELQVNGGLAKDTIVSGTSLTFALSAASNSTTIFNWNVKGIGNYNQTAYNPVPFTFTLDLKPPAAPSMTWPAYGASVKDTVTLKWIRGSTDAISDSIYIADDSTFSNIVSQQWSDVSKLRISELGLVPNSGSSYYWWRVRSFDAVGNRSSFNGKFKFRLIP